MAGVQSTRKAQLKKQFAPYRKWLGEWSGKGVTKNDVAVSTRLVIQTRMAEQAVEFLVESVSADTGELIHGVIGLLAVDPDGQMRMVVFSTLHGSMLMPVTPEDPGALAIEGTNVQGNRVVVSLIEEDGGLMLTSYWRPELPADAEPVGFTNIKLMRVSLAGA